MRERARASVPGTSRGRPRDIRAIVAFALAFVCTLYFQRALLDPQNANNLLWRESERLEFFDDEPHAKAPEDAGGEPSRCDDRCFRESIYFFPISIGPML